MENKEIFEIQERLNKLPKEIEKAGTQMAEFKGAYEFFSELKKKEKAEVMVKIKELKAKKGEKITMAELEMLSMTVKGENNPYLICLKNMRDSCIAYYEWKTKYEALKLEFQSYISLHSYLKDERKNDFSKYSNETNFK